MSQEEIDWRFARLLGGLQYSGFKWDETAGIAITEYIIEGNWDTSSARSMTEEEYFTQFLGISLENYWLLKYKVYAQYTISGWGKQEPNKDQINDYKKKVEKILGKTFKEGEFEILYKKDYNNMKGKGDFVHQQITTATILAINLKKSGIIVNIYWGEIQSVKEWLVG